MPKLTTKLAALKAKAVETAAPDKEVLGTDQAMQAIKIMNTVLSSYKKTNGYSPVIYNNKRTNSRYIKYYRVGNGYVKKASALLKKANIPHQLLAAMDFSAFDKKKHRKGIAVSIAFNIPLDFDFKAANKIAKTEPEPKPLKRVKTTIGKGATGSRTFKTHPADFKADIQQVFDSYGVPATKTAAMLKALDKWAK